MTTQSNLSPLRILRMRQVMARTGLARSTIYEHIRNKRFPNQVTLGPHSVGWVERDIDAWIAERIEASRQVG